MLKIFDIRENTFVGIFIRACDKFVVTPSILEDFENDLMESIFQVPVLQTTIGSANILGSLISMNSHGAVVSNIINNSEFQTLAKSMNITILKEKNNALGNCILASETKALISPFLSKKSERFIQNVMDVETLRGTIAEQDNLGMSAVVTEKGLLCHPKITREEKEVIDDFFGMKSRLGTINFGIPLIGAGLAANSNGAITGSKTTGVELNRIENALDLI